MELVLMLAIPAIRLVLIGTKPVIELVLILFTPIYRNNYIS